MFFVPHMQTMTVLLRHIIDHLNTAAPFNLAESWDNVGLLVGSTESPVTSILIGLDATNSLLDEAIQLGADTIVTHLPVIFKPLARIDTADPLGRLLQKALAHNIAIIACHTNLDNAIDGVSDILGRALGLTQLSPLLPSPNATGSATGLGRIGRFTTPVTPGQFLHTALQALGLTSIQVAGPLPTSIQTVAVCGGSGSDLAALALSRGADLYLSAEIKHSTARWAEENDFCIIDGTHYGTEHAAVQLLANMLQAMCASQHWQIAVAQTKTEKPPFVSITHENCANM